MLNMKFVKSIFSIILALALLLSMAGQVLAESPAKTVLKTYEQLFPDPYFAELVAYHTGHHVMDIAVQSDLDQITELTVFDGDIQIVDCIFDLTGIGNLRNLESINLPDLCIISVPDEIGSLKELKNIDLSGNQIVYVTEELSSNITVDIPDNVATKRSTLADQDLKSGNIPVKYIPHSTITYSAKGAPMLTDKVKSIPAPANAVEVGETADRSIAAKNAKIVEKMLKEMPVCEYEEYYIAGTGAVALYGSGGELIRVEGDYEYFSNLDQYLVNCSLPKGVIYRGTYSEFSESVIQSNSTSSVSGTVISGRFTTYGDLWPVLPTSEPVNYIDPNKDWRIYGDRIGSRSNILKIGDAATKEAGDTIAFGTRLTVAVQAPDTNGSGPMQKTMYKRDVGAMPNAVLDIWRWDDPNWHTGIGQSPNNLYFGQKWNSLRSFEYNGNWFAYDG